MLYGLLSHPVRLTGSDTVKSTSGCVTALKVIGGGAYLRDGGVSGDIVWEALDGDGLAFCSPLKFETDIYCEFLSGTTSVSIAYQELQE